MFQPKYEDKINRTLQKDEKKVMMEMVRKATHLSESCLAKTKIVGTKFLPYYHLLNLGQPYGLMLQFEKFHNLFNE